jgi:hypothetical protein
MQQAFIQVVTAGQPQAPACFNCDAVLNSQERPTLDLPLFLRRVLQCFLYARRRR